MPLNSPQDWQTALADTWMLEYVRDYQVPSSFDEVMADEAWYSIFYYYAQQEYATESLDFIRTAETFAANGDLGLAKQIYDTYIADSAPQQINISGATRQALDAIFGEGGTEFGPPNLFDSATTEIRRMVAGDTYRRFATSATAAQEALAQQIDWDNVQGR